MIGVNAVRDNAMLYKDLTQWLRNKTFLMRFFGLLLLAEAVCVVMISLPDNVPAPGMISFGVLSGILSLYVLMVAFSGFTLTSREFSSRTFELYELAGMSLERMVFGKFLSMVTQFLFGYFCVVPFMFFSFFLGGLDFSIIVTTALGTVVLVIPVFLVTLITSFTGKHKAASVIRRVIAVFVALWFIQMIGGAVVGLMSFRAGPLTGLSRTLSSFSGETVVWVLVFLVFYVQVCLFLFYLCCNIISRQNDSREIALKVLILTLCFSWLALIAAIMLRTGSFDEGYGYAVGPPVFLVLCIAGLFFYYNRSEVPRVVRKRYEKRRLLLPVYYVFRPGPAGTFRLFVLVFLGVVAFGLLINHLGAASSRSHRQSLGFNAGLSIALQAAFFIAVPGALLLRSRFVRGRYARLRKLITVWWLVAATALALSASLLFSVYSPGASASFEPVIRFVALILSPFSTPLAAMGRSNSIEAAAPYVRMGLGLLGLWIMGSASRRGKRKQPVPPPTS